MGGESRQDAIRVATPTMSAVAQGVSWKGLGQAVGESTWYGSLVLLAAMLPPRAFGIVAVGLVIVGVTRLLMESGTGGGIIISKHLTGTELRDFVARNFAIGSGCTVVLALLSGPIAETFAGGADPTVLRVMLLSVPIAALGIVPIALLDKTLRFKRRAQVTVVAAVGSSLAALAVAVAGGGVWALVTRQVLNQGLLTTLAWISVRNAWPQAGGRRPGPRIPRTGGVWFLLIAASNFAAFSLDNLIVGSLVGVAQLGLYALAFTLAFAPLTRVSWAVGGVLFPALAATRDEEQVRRRTLKSMRLMALLLLPWVPAAVALAPVLIPGVLGEKWSGMVVPFQLMIIAGVAHGVLNVLAETFAGTGNARFRARVDVLWALGTLAAVVALTATHGIRGAAVAHLLMFTVLAGAYVALGLHRLGLSPRRLFGSLRGILLCVGGQSVIGAMVAAGLAVLGTPDAGVALGAAVAGLGSGLILLLALEGELLREAREVLTSALHARAARAT